MSNATGDRNRGAAAAVLLARPDAAGDLHQVGLSLPLTPWLRHGLGEHLTPTGGDTRLLSAGRFGGGHTEYLPVELDTVVEIQAEAGPS